MTGNFEEERLSLLEKISSLQKSLDWYVNTYEKRSLAGIIYERIFKKVSSPTNAKIVKTPSTLSGKILCTIVNHNYSKNAEALNNLLSNHFDTLIIDSGSDIPPKHSLKLDNVYYSGLLNKAYSVAIENKYPYLLFICSDVLINEREASKMYDRLSNMDLSKIGLYAPASKGNSYIFCSKQTSDTLRTVPFVEGFMFLCDISILDNLCPIDTEKNLYGWGLDIAKAFYAADKNKLCLIDDNLEVEHMAGTGYSREIAKIEMTSWIKSLKNESLLNFFENAMSSTNV